MQMSQYLPLFLLGVLGVVFALASFWISRLVAPHRDSAAKRTPYECGIVEVRGRAERFPVRFYLMAMVFVILDVEIAFLIPWALHSEALGALGVWEMVAFSVVVMICLIYLLANGALNWGSPRRYEQDADPMSTIRKIPNMVSRKDEVALAGEESSKGER